MIAAVEVQNGWTALMAAAENGRKAVVEYLLDEDAQVNQQNSVRIDVAVAFFSSRALQIHFKCQTLACVHTASVLCHAVPNYLFLAVSNAGLPSCWTCSMDGQP